MFENLLRARFLIHVFLSQDKTVNEISSTSCTVEVLGIEFESSRSLISWKTLCIIMESKGKIQINREE